MNTSKFKGFFSFTLFALTLISCSSQEDKSTQASQAGSTQSLKVETKPSSTKSKAISAINNDVKNIKININSTIDKCMQESDSNDEFIGLAQSAYMQHQTLYTGGMHFKALDSVFGSSMLYFMMSNRLDLIQEIKTSLGENSRWSFYCSWRDCPLKMLGSRHTRYGLQDRYTINPRQVMKSAIRVVENQEKAYAHLNKKDLSYSVHLGQAAFDLDIFTSRGEPVDWWLSSEFPKGYGHLQFAVWEAAKEHDLIDWLQFTATASYRNHLQNWSFENTTDKRASYQNLAKYAATRWKKTGSYAWLSALAEVVEPSDPQAQIVIHEFNALADKVLDCNVTSAQRVAFWAMYTNALRIGSALELDMSKWLTAYDSHFRSIKNTAVRRMFKYLATTHTREKLKELPSIKALFPEGKLTYISWMTIDNKAELLESESLKNLSSIHKKIEPVLLSDTYLRYVSFLSTEELISLYLKLEPIASNTTLFDKQYKQKTFRNKLRLLVSTAFIRDWIINDLSNDDMLEILARTEPELKDKINLIIAEPDSDSRRLMLFRMVLQSPGMTYKIGIPLFLPHFAEERNRTEESISKLITSNPEDGNWWCATDAATIVNRLANDMAQSFGFNGGNLRTSGGKWGTSYYNPGQKRSDLRPGNVVLTAPKLHKTVVMKYRELPYLQRQLATDEWQSLATLPSAPVYFSNKLDELSKRMSLDRTTQIELNTWLLRAAHQTCRKDASVHEVYRKTKEKLKIL